MFEQMSKKWALAGQRGDKMQAKLKSGFVLRIFRNLQKKLYVFLQFCTKSYRLVVPYGIRKTIPAPVFSLAIILPLSMLAAYSISSSGGTPKNSSLEKQDDIESTNIKIQSNESSQEQQPAKSTQTNSEVTETDLKVNGQNVPVPDNGTSESTINTGGDKTSVKVKSSSRQTSTGGVRNSSKTTITTDIDTGFDSETTIRRRSGQW